MTRWLRRLLMIAAMVGGSLVAAPALAADQAIELAEFEPPALPFPATAVEVEVPSIGTGSTGIMIFGSSTAITGVILFVSGLLQPREDLNGDGEFDPGETFFRRALMLGGGFMMLSGAGLIVVGKGVSVRVRF